MLRSVCTLHGVDAEGIEGKAQDLTHRISEAQVLYTIENGQNSLGYAMGAMLQIWLVEMMLKL